jgi:hypothetical protein
MLSLVGPREDHSGSDTPRNACPKLASYGGDKAKPSVSTSGGFAVSGLPTAQHAARLLQRNVRFAAAQHSLCIVSRAFWCYACQQGMGKASCLSVSFLTSLPLGLA